VQLPKILFSNSGIICLHSFALIICGFLFITFEYKNQVLPAHSFNKTETVRVLNSKAKQSKVPQNIHYAVKK